MSARDDDKSASIPVPDGENACWIGWPAAVERLQRAITERCSSKPILVVESYPGVDAETILRELQPRLKPTLAFQTSTVFHQPQRIEKLLQPYVDESPSRFAPNHTLTLPEFFDAERLWHARREIEDLREGLVLIVGCGASLIAWGQVLVYADLTRNEARQRLSHLVSNLGVENQNLAPERKLHIAARVDWPVADRWKRPLIAHWDFMLETKPENAPTLFDGEAVLRSLQLAVQRPFCFASSPSELSPPSSDANNSSYANSAWLEGNLRLSFGAVQIELPALDLLMAHPRALLGDAAFLRFAFRCPLPLKGLDEAIDSYAPFKSGDGWREERTTLPGDSPVELSRLQFERGVTRHTNGCLTVLRLTEGAKVGVESPGGTFAPLLFHRGQTFIMPAAVGEFRLRPNGLSDRPHVILTASVRTGN